MTKKERNQEAGSLTRTHAYNGIRSFLPPELNEKLIDELGIRKNLERRISGLNCEYEFALIAHFSEKFKHILGFDEAFSKLTNAKTPDFLLYAKDGKKYFIEVKSSSKNKFSDITNSNLEKRLNLALDLGAEWLLAIKMENRWGLFDYNTFKSKGRKISYPLDLNDSIFMNFFGFDYYVKNSQIVAESIFSNKDHKDKQSIQHDKYGNLIHYILRTNTNCLIDSSSMQKSILVEIFHDYFSNLQEEKISETDTKITEILEEPVLISTDQCMMASLSRTINDFGRLNDPKTFFDNFINHKHENSKINAYKNFWSKIIQKCSNSEIFIPSNVIFFEDGSIQVKLKK